MNSMTKETCHKPFFTLIRHSNSALKRVIQISKVTETSWLFHCYYFFLSSPSPFQHFSGLSLLWPPLPRVHFHSWISIGLLFTLCSDLLRVKSVLPNSHEIVFTYTYICKRMSFNGIPETSFLSTGQRSSSLWYQQTTDNWNTLYVTPSQYIIRKFLNNLFLQPKKISLLKFIWGAVKKRCGCGDKKSSLCSCKACEVKCLWIGLLLSHAKWD